MVSEASTSEISERISQLIRERQLRPGDRLPSIRELASQFGEKASAIRSGLMLAQNQGVVRVMPRAGAFVDRGSGMQDDTRSRASSEPGLGERPADYNLFHLLDARRTIELELAVRAAKNRRLEDLEPVRRTLEQMAEIPRLERRANYVELDIRFHTQIARLGGNDVLAQFVADVLTRLRGHLEDLPWTSGRRSKTDESHTAIYVALVDADEAAVRHEMEQHLRAAYDSLLHRLRTPPNVLPDSGGNHAKT